MSPRQALQVLPFERFDDVSTRRGVELSRRGSLLGGQHVARISWRVPSTVVAPDLMILESVVVKLEQEFALWWDIIWACVHQSFVGLFYVLFTYKSYL